MRVTICFALLLLLCNLSSAQRKPKVKSIDDMMSSFGRMDSLRALGPDTVDLSRNYQKMSTADQVSYAERLLVEAEDNCLTQCAEYSLLWHDAIENGRNFSDDLNAASSSYRNNRAGSKVKRMGDLASAVIDAIKLGHKVNARVYDALVDTYATYTQILSLTLDPTGSYITFNQKVDDLKSQFVGNKSKLDVAKGKY